MRGARIIWTADELQFIKDRRLQSRAEIHAAFVARFGRQDITVDNIKSLCSRKGWSAGAAGKLRRKGASTLLTPAQQAWLRRNADLSRADVGPAFRAAHPDSPLTDAQIVSWRKRNGIKTGRDGRFPPGHEPWTKGRKIGSHPNSAKTQFKRGQDPHNAVPIGHERRSPDGYVLICVDSPNPWTGSKTHMVFKHKENWIAAHGPIPKGHVLKCLDGDKTNCDPSNWEAIPRGLLPRLNGKCGRDYDTAPGELKPLIMATAKLEHKARERVK